jgi:hypothetical protein
MLLKAVDKKNMTVKEFWASSAIPDAIMSCGQIRAAITCLCLNGVWKENCSYLVHDCRGFSVQCSNKEENIVQPANIVGFKMVHMDYVVDLVMSHKELLRN